MGIAERNALAAQDWCGALDIFLSRATAARVSLASSGCPCREIELFRPLCWGMILGPDMELSESNEALQKMNWRSGGSGLGSYSPAT